MIHTQRWIPDTCANSAANDSCIFLETWDDSVDVVARTHDFSKRERVCSRHAALEAAASFLANYDENRRKNVTWSAILNVKPNFLLEQFQWSFRADGVLLVGLGANLTSQQKNQLQNICDIQFGAGKVIIS